MLVLLYPDKTPLKGFSQALGPLLCTHYLPASAPDFWRRRGTQLTFAQLPPSNTQELSPSEQPNNDDRSGQKLGSYSRCYPDGLRTEGDSEIICTMTPWSNAGDGNQSTATSGKYTVEHWLSLTSSIACLRDFSLCTTKFKELQVVSKMLCSSFPLHPNYLQPTVSYHSGKMRFYLFL